jgi:hypothetical protein
VTDKDAKRKKERAGVDQSSVNLASWLNSDDAFSGTEEEELEDYEPVSLKLSTALSDSAAMTRLQWIKESHALLEQFNPKELKTLMNLKRNTSPKAWTLREDLMVLSLAVSNREMAGVLKDRNKEAVKKRLQLLRSKGLLKRTRDPLAT